MEAFSPMRAVGGDGGQRMDAGRGARRLIEKLQGAGEIEIGIGGDRVGETVRWLGLR